MNLCLEILGCQGLLVEIGDVWKTARHTLTPAFSRLKMKMVCKIGGCYSH